MANMPYCQQSVFTQIISLHLVKDIPCTTTSTWDIPSHTTRELLFLLTSFTPVCYSIFSFLSLTNQELNRNHTCQKNCCQVLPTHFRGHANARANCTFYRFSKASSPSHLSSPGGFRLFTVTRRPKSMIIDYVSPCTFSVWWMQDIFVIRHPPTLCFFCSSSTPLI